VIDFGGTSLCRRNPWHVRGSLFLLGFVFIGIFMANYSTNEFKSGLKLMIDGDPCSIPARFPCCMRVLGLGKGDWIETESKATFSY